MSLSYIAVALSTPGQSTSLAIKLTASPVKLLGFRVPRAIKSDMQLAFTKQQAVT